MKKNNNQNITKVIFIMIFGISIPLLAINFNEDAPIIQPGAPGEISKKLDPEAAVSIARTSFVDADIKFLQGMIVHHEQAILMSKLASKRTNNKTILDLANRIEISQVDEINFMKSWLKSRSNSQIDKTHKHHMTMKMSGMASPDQIIELEKANSTDFDRLFLQLMISHHDGALDMVDELNKYPGSANDQLLNEFVSDLINDQAVEIERMNSIAVNLSNDPRAGLTSGLFTANEAILNLEKIISLRKPVGFYDPNNPGEKGKRDTTIDIDENEAITTLELSRSFKAPILDFANTDMAFRDNLLITGSYHGFNIYEILNNGIPQLVSSIVCPGGQGDVSIVDNILIMSVEESRSRIDCGLSGVGDDASPDSCLLYTSPSPRD